MKARLLRTQIMDNEELGALGAQHTLLFERLILLADREGRLLDLPERIKTVAFQHYEEFTTENIDQMLGALEACGFVLRYSCPSPAEKVVKNGATKSGFPQSSSGRERRVLQIVNFLKHNSIHHDEPACKLPPPPDYTPPPTPTNKERSAATKSTERHTRTARAPRESRARTSRTSRAPLPLPLTEVVSTARSIDNDRPNARELRSVASIPEKPPKRKPPATDLWPHSKDPERVAIFRNTLASLGSWYHLPSPDDAMVRRILDLCEDMTGENFYKLIRQLELERRFNGMRSYGLVPEVLRPLLARRQGTG